MDKKLLTVTEAARLLKCDYATLKNAVDSKQVHSIKIGKRRYIRNATIDKLLEGE